MTNTKSSKNKSAIVDMVYSEIRQSLMMGRFTPGQKVSLRSLSEEVGTSLTPVRGAVNRLIAEGAFDVLPNRWIVIPAMTREKFDEITYWRVQLESDAARRAARNRTSKLIKEVEAINRDMIKTGKDGGDRKSLLSQNYKFHFAIYTASDSSILLPMIESLWLQAGAFTYYSLLSPKDLWDAKYHIDIIDALKKGDEDAIAEAVTNDIVNTANFLREKGEFEKPKMKKIVA
ncbi:MAG: GntR family transcriptional regulator [Gammaproteobacteria bacterium]